MSNPLLSRLLLSLAATLVAQLIFGPEYASTIYAGLAGWWVADAAKWDRKFQELKEEQDSVGQKTTGEN